MIRHHSVLCFRDSALFCILPWFSIILHTSVIQCHSVHFRDSMSFCTLPWFSVICTRLPWFSMILFTSMSELVSWLVFWAQSTTNTSMIQHHSVHFRDSASFCRLPWFSVILLDFRDSATFCIRLPRFSTCARINATSVFQFVHNTSVIHQSHQTFVI